MGKQSLDRKKKDKKKKSKKNSDDDKKKKKDKMKKKGSKVSQSPQMVKQSPPQLSSPGKKQENEDKEIGDLEKPPIEYGSDQSGNRKKLSDKEPKLKKKSSKIEPPKSISDKKDEEDEQMKKGTPTSNMKKVSSGNIKKRSARLDVPKDSSEEKELGKVKKVPSSNIKKIPSTQVKKRSSRIEIQNDSSEEKQLRDEEKVKRALTGNMRKISPANTKKRSSRLDIPKDLSDENLNGDELNGKKVSTTSNMKKLSPVHPKKRSSRHELPKDLSDDDYFGEVKKVPSSANKKVASGRMEVKKTPSKSTFGQVPKKISKTGLSPESTGNSDQHEVRLTPSVVRRDLYNVMDEADGISDQKKLDYDPQQSLQKTQSDIGPPKSVSGSNPLQPVRSQLQMPNTLGIAKNSPGGITVHPLSLVRIDGDLIGRTGMYIERSGMSAAKKRAFDWLGLNRHQYQQKAGETVKNLEIALSDVGISKELFNQTLPILLADRQITQNEMDSVKQKLSNEYRGDFLTLSSAAWLLKENCRTYRRLEDEE